MWTWMRPGNRANVAAVHRMSVVPVSYPATICNPAGSEPAAELIASPMIRLADILHCLSVPGGTVESLEFVDVYRAGTSRHDRRGTASPVHGRGAQSRGDVVRPGHGERPPDGRLYEPDRLTLRRPGQSPATGHVKRESHVRYQRPREEVSIRGDELDNAAASVVHRTRPAVH